jgi:3-oxoacyl-[acyl-carrier protein] reductase
MNKAVCVITGASSGIGAATARLYASRGWNVAINYSRSAAPAEAVAAECRALGADVLVLKGNVISPEDLAETAWYLGASAAKTTGEVLLVDAGLRISKG